MSELWPAADVPRLGRGEIHLWSVDLAPPEGEVAALRLLLSAEERQRADRFHFDRHRRRFTVRRARLRQLVARYLSGGPRPMDPLAVRFAYGERGKPSVEVPGQPLAFNLSDSEDLAVYAFSQDLELGVDVEVLRPMPDALQISERFFADAEREVLRRVAEERLAEAFFCCWTRKEAYIKAIGEGLAEPLKNFCVAFDPPEPARFLHVGGSPEEAAAWTLHHLEPAMGAVGALAYRGPRRDLVCRRWDQEVGRKL